jgi:Ca2+-binding RTX toxin-like protein
VPALPLPSPALFKAKENPTAGAQTIAELDILLTALSRTKLVRDEIDRVASITNSVPNSGPAQIAASAVDAVKLDYQLAVLTASKDTNGYRTGSADLIYDAANNARAMVGGLSNVFDIYGATWPSAVSNSQIHYGTATAIAIEDQPLIRGNAVADAIRASALYADVKLLVDNFGQNDFGDTHSLVLLVDSLTVQSVFAQLDSTFNTAKFAPIMQAASNVKSHNLPNAQGVAEGDALENIVNALVRTFKLNIAPLKGDTRGNTWFELERPDGYTGRTEFHEALSTLVKSDEFNLIAGDVVVSATGSNIAAQAKARVGFEDIVALETLSTFKLEAANNDGKVALETLWASGDWSDDYQGWQDDVAALQAGEVVTRYTDQWIADRARLLQTLTLRNSQNQETDHVLDPGITGDRVLFFDYDESVGVHKTISVQSRTVAGLKDQHIVFDSDSANTLQGFDNVLGDHLYGGGGNDTVNGKGGDDYLEGNAGNDNLDGGAGNDRLKGGAGNDTYYLRASDSGIDTIIDADGSIKVVAADNSETTLGLGTIKKISNGSSTSSGTWQSEDKRFTYITHTEADNSTTLSISGAGISAVVKNFTSGNLGITLPGTVATQPTPTTGQQILGDFAAMDFNGAEDGVQTQLDALGNIITDPNQAQPDLADNLYDSANDDEIIAGGGADTITATRGGINWIKAGRGRDMVQSGAGNDLIEMGTERDYAHGGAGADRLYADVRHTLDEVLEQTVAALDDQADILDGGSGDDTVMGDAGNDALYGGEGKDLLVGGAGDDAMFGDMETSSVQAGWSVSQQILLNGNGDVVGVQLNVSGVTTQLAVDQGIDLMFGGAGNDYMLGNGGDDYLDGGTGADNMFGGTGADVLAGGEGNDHLDGDGSTLSATQHEYAAASGHGNDMLDGGEGNDVLNGNGGNDLLYGGEGNDMIFGDEDKLASSPGFLSGEFHGNDYADGGAGNDYIEGNGGDDSLYGGTGDDTLWGDAGGDLKLAGEFHGADYLDGGEGNDSLSGGGANDVLYGGAGNDHLSGDETEKGNEFNLAGNFHGKDFLDGGDGDDTLEGDGNDDTLLGGAGADILYGDSTETFLSGQYHGKDFLDGGAGNDTLMGGGGDDVLYGGDGDDILRGDDTLQNLAAEFHGNDTLYGGAGNDTLIGGGGADYMDGGEGNDSYEAGAGDTVVDSRGTNTLTLTDGDPSSVTASGNDLLLDYGSDGTLTIKGALSGGMASINGLALSQWLQDHLTSSMSLATTEENQTLTGGAGGDELTALHGGAILLGGAGRDTLMGSVGVDTLSGGTGNDTLDAGGGNDVLAGDAGDDWLSAGAGDDALDGGAGSDSLYGGDGADALSGGEGDDLMDGGAGNDVFHAGTGHDTLIGGAGMDTFVLGYGMGQATVLDASPEGSVIQLDASGLQLQNLSAQRSGDDLMVQVRGTETQMRIKDYYGETQTSWVFKDAQGNALSAQALITASTPQWGSLQSSLLQEFKSWAWGSIGQQYFGEGYVKQAEGSWLRPSSFDRNGGTFSNVSIETATEAVYTHRLLADLGNPNPLVTTTTHVQSTSWSTDQWAETNFEADDKTISFGDVASTVSDAFITLDGVTSSTDSQEAWSEVTWQHSSTSTYAYQWSLPHTYEWPETTPDELITEQHRTVQTWRGYTGNGRPLTFENPGVNALSGYLPDYIAVTLNHNYLNYNLGETTLSDGDHTVTANRYSAVIGGVGDNIIYGAGFAYGGTGNAQLIGGEFLMAGTGDQYLEGGRTMVVGDGHTTVVGMAGQLYEERGSSPYISRQVYKEFDTRILIDPNNTGIDLLVNDDYSRSDQDSNGVDDAIEAIYRSMGIADVVESAMYGGKYHFYHPEIADGYFDTLEEALQRWNDISMVTYIKPLSVLLTTSDFDLTGSVQNNSYYDTHPIQTVLLTPNNFSTLQPYLDVGLMPMKTVSFGQGISLSDIALSWGEAVSPLDGKPRATLDLQWGVGQGVRIMIPRFDDPFNGTVGQFEFADGQRVSMSDLVAMAPPAPNFDVVGFSALHTGMGHQVVAANEAQGIYTGSLSADDVLVYSDGIDLVISANNGQDSLRLTGWFSDAGPQVDVFLISDDGSFISTDALYDRGLLKDGSAGNLTLYGVPDYGTTFIAGPNTTLVGQSGYDTYIYNEGSGEVHITDPGGGSLRFGSGITASMISLHLGSSLLLKVGEQGDVIYLQNFDAADVANFWSVQSFTFTDGTVFDFGELLDIGFDFHGTANADLITGTNTTDRLYGGAGDDSLRGGAGDDILDGGAGSDVYLFDRDHGGDTIHDTGPDAGDIDTVRFDASVSAADVEVSRDEFNLYLSIDGSAGQIQISNWFGPSANTIERLEFADGTVWSKVDVENRIPVFAEGSEGSDLLQGMAGNDQLVGNGGDDTLSGGAGSDSLIGGTGDDTYQFGRGDGADTIQEDDATVDNTDTLQFLDGVASDQIWLRQAANDLEVSIIGTTDSVILSNWYLGDQYHVEQFRTHDGKALVDSQVQVLVEAMAAFSPPAAGETMLSAGYQAALQPVIAANWQ